MPDLPTLYTNMVLVGLTAGAAVATVLGVGFGLFWLCVTAYEVTLRYRQSKDYAPRGRRLRWAIRAHFKNKYPDELEGAE